ncbi:19575_t:CDS:2 [Gigaspora rosea]|nr:19575_t:CDS:2 [Gigaspora rosea]
MKSEENIEPIEVRFSNIVGCNENLKLYNVHNIEIESKNNSKPINLLRNDKLHNIYNIEMESEDNIEPFELFQNFYQSNFDYRLISNKNLELHNIYNVELENKDIIEPIEVQSSHTTGCNKGLANTMKALIISQMFGSWNELDHFISSYAKSQNFVIIIHGSEYKDGICQNHRYVCEHQGRSGTNNTSIAKNQQQI